MRPQTAKKALDCLKGPRLPKKPQTTQEAPVYPKGCRLPKRFQTTQEAPDCPRGPRLPKRPQTAQSSGSNLSQPTTYWLFTLSDINLSRSSLVASKPCISPLFTTTDNHTSAATTTTITILATAARKGMGWGLEEVMSVQHSQYSSTARPRARSRNCLMLRCTCSMPDRRMSRAARR